MSTKLDMNLPTLAIVVACIVGGCKGNSDNDVQPDQFALQLALLENNNQPWVLATGSVVKDGIDVSSQYTGFELSITGHNFTTMNSLKNVWPSQGTWLFHQDNINVVERSDGVLINIVLSSNVLQVSFTDPIGSLGGKVEGIPGDYVFTLHAN